MIARALLLALFLATAPDTVRIAEHGTRWHRFGCAALAHGSVLVRRTAADSAGYVPCKRCINPPARKASMWRGAR